MEKELDPREIRTKFAMTPHPEGGYYAENFRDNAEGGAGISSAIYFLLEAGDVSAWHRLRNATEIWHFYAGSPLILTLSSDGRETTHRRLGTDLHAGHLPQIVVPRGWWQTAATLGHWTFVGCTVAPGFDFADFELAPKGWHPSPLEEEAQ